MPAAFVIFAVLTAALANAAPVATDVAALYRGGQVFITWSELQPCDARFRVLSSTTPITAANAKDADVLCDDVGAGSATD